MSRIEGALPFQAQHETVQTAANAQEANIIAGSEEFAFFRQSRGQWERYSPHVPKEFEGAELFLSWDAECFQNGIAVPRPDLVADHLIELIGRPADLAKELVPGPQTQIDAVLQYLARVCLHERNHDVPEAEIDTSLDQRAGLVAKNLFDRVNRGRQEGLHSPAAESVVLQCALRNAAKDFSTFLAGQFFTDNQNGNRTRSASERRYRFAEYLRRFRLDHSIDNILVDFTGCFGGDDEAGLGLPELNPIGNIHDDV
jgi:hypothetical protein